MSKTFVLLHGAWHGGWCWVRVADALRARGHRVTTPTQTGLGERRHLLSRDIGLGTFIDDLVNHILAEGLTDATLVGHSFGGNALSGAAEAIPDRIAELVYLDSTIVQPGQRPIDAIDADKLKNRMDLAHNHAVGLPPPPASAFGITDPADTAWVETQMTDHPLATMLDALPIQHRPGNGLKARYIACTNPGYHPADRIKAWTEPVGWPVQELRCGHDAMVIAPAALTEMLDQ